MAALDLLPLWLSIATTLSATVLTFFLGLFYAWRMLGIRSRWRGWIDGLLTLPLILPPTVVGYVLLILFGARSPIGRGLERIGMVIVFSCQPR